MITILLYNSALELVPKKLHHHPSIVNDSKIRRKTNLLLDLAVHHPALEKAEKIGRGRPDIVHLCMLEFHHTMQMINESNIQLIVHTVDDLSFKIPYFWRIPVSYIRFRGLMEKFLVERKLTFNNESSIIISRKRVVDLILENNSSKIISLTHIGRLIKKDDIINIREQYLVNNQNLLILIGGFQSGSDFKAEELNIDNLSFSNQMIPAWKTLNILLNNLFPIE